MVPNSVTDPVGYYRANVTKSLDFIAHLLRNGCGRLIFSSSAAIYRAGADLSVDEDSVIDPQSPYARTKAVCEAMFADIAASQPIRVLSLRYFNPIGADPKMRTGLQLARPTHALGKMIQAQQEGVPFVITGTDWPTRDGSGLRDYVHVWDLATAHVAALTRFTRCPGLPPPSTWAPAPAPRSASCSPLSTGWPAAWSACARRPGGPATPPASAAGSTARNACWAGGRSTTSPRASAIRCSGPRSANRSFEVRPAIPAQR